MDFSRKACSTPAKCACAYLKDCTNIHIYPGIFPQTADPVREHRFSLVSLDVDTYQSTKDGLNFFIPRLNPGGILLSHDYQYPGVARAFEETGLAARTIKLPTSCVCSLPENPFFSSGS
ncbi:MAG: hypothetical protein OHK0052_06640 [Anaerolineales bacterium]